MPRGRTFFEVLNRRGREQKWGSKVSSSPVLDTRRRHGVYRMNKTLSLYESCLSLQGGRKKSCLFQHFSVTWKPGRTGEVKATIDKLLVLKVLSMENFML